MRLSIAICTWNRSSLLRQTLERMCELRTPKGATWELIVVNNNCTDDTAAVLEAYASRLPLRAVEERKPGLSHARNAAIDAATGDWILWTDDDVLVAPDWLEAYHAAMVAHPEIAFWGGALEPWFEGDPPRWLPPSLPRLAAVYCVADVGDRAVHPDDAPLPFGASFAVRADLQRERRYDARLGRRAGNLLGGEETAVIRSLMRDGHAGRWLSTARARHFVPRARQSVAYLRRYFHDFGVSMASLEGANGARRFLGRPLWMWKQAVVCELRYRFWRLLARPERWVPDLEAASMAWGGLRGRPARVPNA